MIFLVGTCLLAFVSRRSLLRPRTHGFIRFFVFESILALALLNLPVWFVNPLGWHQIVSWLLLVTGLAPLMMGVRELRRHGHVDPAQRTEPELFEFERTSRLVSSGIFHYIRHPLYASLLMLAWGVFFKSPSVLGAGIATVATAGLIIMSRMDEAECLRVFGAEYRQYMLRTKRFVPRLI
jgi:protein-S-isoprenylcysteine O-methyltransferase Ste14